MSLEYLAEIEKEEFQHVAGILRLIFYNREWQKKHVPEIAFRGEWDSIIKMLDINSFQDPYHRMAVFQKLMDMLRKIHVATIDDSHILLKYKRRNDFQYTKKDTDWVLEVTTCKPPEYAVGVMGLLFAYASALDKKPNWLTPAELAAKTGTSESMWRNKAAAGELPGAIKKGNQWLINPVVLEGSEIEPE